MFIYCYYVVVFRWHIWTTKVQMCIKAVKVNQAHSLSSERKLNHRTTAVIH